MGGADADPLSVRSKTVMGILLIVLVLTFGLSVRAGVFGRRSITAKSRTETGDEPWLIDSCAKTLLLVLVSLLGLLALGVMFGNVLGTSTPAVSAF